MLEGISLVKFSNVNMNTPIFVNTIGLKNSMVQKSSKYFQDRCQILTEPDIK